MIIMKRYTRDAVVLWRRAVACYPAAYRHSCRSFQAISWKSSIAYTRSTTDNAQFGSRGSLNFAAKCTAILPTMYICDSVRLGSSYRSVNYSCNPWIRHYGQTNTISGLGKTSHSSINFMQTKSLSTISSTSSITSTAPTPTAESQSDQQEDEEEKQRRFKAWQRMKLSFILMGSFFTFMSCYSFYLLGSPELDEQGREIEDEFSKLPIVQQRMKRFYNKVLYYTKLIQEPSQEKLLPDPLPIEYGQPTYTLVIELTDLLVHPDWTYQTGWRFKKRPHIDTFLEQALASSFEIVIFTGESAMTMIPIVNQLNKNGLPMYSLYRDSTDFRDGHHVKNLNWLNRDLNKVVVIDWNPQSIKLHPENAFIIPRWNGNDDDHTLLDLAAFLRVIASNRVDDVREVLQHYRQFDDPVAAFRENKRVLLEQMEEQERLELARKEHPPLTKKFAKSYTR